MKTVYLIRHGKISLPDGEKRYIGQIDLPLSEEGLSGMQKRGETLSQKHMDAVFCSDLTRSRESAGIIARFHGLIPEVRTDLGEIAMGDWEGMTFKEVKLRYPEEFAARGADIGHFRPPNGESFMDARDRVIPAFLSILASPAKDIAIVAHAGVNRLILSHILGMPLDHIFRISQDYACLNMIRVQNSGMRIDSLNT